MQNAYDSNYSLLCKWQNLPWNVQIQQEYMLIDISIKKFYSRVRSGAYT
jgi:hypothetical protein